MPSFSMEANVRKRQTSWHCPVKEALWKVPAGFRKIIEEGKQQDLFHHYNFSATFPQLLQTLSFRESKYVLMLYVMLNLCITSFLLLSVSFACYLRSYCSL